MFGSRFLQLADEDEDVVPQMDDSLRLQIQHANWQIVNCSTPANYYHVLRRQVPKNIDPCICLISQEVALLFFYSMLTHCWVIRCTATSASR